MFSDWKTEPGCQPLGRLKLLFASRMICIRNMLPGVWTLSLITALSASSQDRPQSAPAAPVPSGNPSKHSYWAVEDASEREKLPLYKIIPAAKPQELTPANGYPKSETFLTWHRSHGDNGGMRYSALDQIDRHNVRNLQQAWIYHSRDGSNNLQCNPIVVRDLIIAPTAGRSMVGINGENGTERWRFKPEGRPAFRGLIYWPGIENAKERIMFCAGKYLYALNPNKGEAITTFGENGRTLLPGRAQGDFGAATAGPAIFHDIIVVPGFEKDVWGFDVVTGKHLWTFHTVPHPGEFGYETWDRTEEYAANCWTGMALDEVRGIAYIATGGPKPNFIGVGHLGDNLFANCLIALDARTGNTFKKFLTIFGIGISPLPRTSRPSLVVVSGWMWSR